MILIFKFYFLWIRKLATVLLELANKDVEVNMQVKLFILIKVLGEDRTVNSSIFSIVKTDFKIVGV